MLDTCRSKYRQQFGGLEPEKHSINHLAAGLCESNDVSKCQYESPRSVIHS